MLQVLNLNAFEKAFKVLRARDVSRTRCASLKIIGLFIRSRRWAEES